MLRVPKGGTMVGSAGREGVRGAVSVRESKMVSVVCVGLRTLTVNPMAREGYALKQGNVLDFARRIAVHDGDVEEADVAELWGGGRLTRVIGVRKLKSHYSKVTISHVSHLFFEDWIKRAQPPGPTFLIFSLPDQISHWSIAFILSLLPQ